MSGSILYRKILIYPERKILPMKHTDTHGKEVNDVLVFWSPNKESVIKNRTTEIKNKNPSVTGIKFSQAQGRQLLSFLIWYQKTLAVKSFDSAASRNQIFSS